MNRLSRFDLILNSVGVIGSVVIEGYGMYRWYWMVQQWAGQG